MDGRENIPQAQAQSHSSTIVKNSIESYNRDVKMVEYARLRSLVPSVAFKSRVSKVRSL